MAQIIFTASLLLVGHKSMATPFLYMSPAMLAMLTMTPRLKRPFVEGLFFSIERDGVYGHEDHA